MKTYLQHGYLTDNAPKCTHEVEHKHVPFDWQKTRPYVYS